MVKSFSFSHAFLVVWCVLEAALLGFHQASQFSLQSCRLSGNDDSVCQVLLTGGDSYDLLGIPIDSSKDDIRKAFRDKSKAVHPDKNDSSLATQAFIKLENARDFLFESFEPSPVPEDVPQQPIEDDSTPVYDTSPIPVPSPEPAQQPVYSHFSSDDVPIGSDVALVLEKLVQSAWALGGDDLIGIALAELPSPNEIEQQLILHNNDVGQTVNYFLERRFNRDPTKPVNFEVDFEPSYSSGGYGTGSGGGNGGRGGGGGGGAGGGGGGGGLAVYGGKEHSVVRLLLISSHFTSIISPHRSQISGPFWWHDPA